MIKKISGHGRSQGSPGNGDKERKQLHGKRVKLKSLHKDVVADRTELQGKSPDQLPPASSSNAARQARSRLNMTFPVDWQSLHLKKSPEDGTEDQKNEQEPERSD